MKSLKICCHLPGKLKDKLWICENPFLFLFGRENIIQRKVSLIKSYTKNYTLINMKKNLIRIIIIAFKHEMKTLYSFKNVKKTILRNNRNDKKGVRKKS